MACVIDLHAYQHGNTLFEDIRACSGESCNYCGRFTESDHDAVVARAATLATQKRLAEIIKMSEGHIFNANGYEFIRLIKVVEESLRQQAGEQQ
jgi:hypothetical protein